MQTEPPPISSGQVQPLLYWIPSPTITSSLLDTSIPRVPIPVMRPPRVTVTSTTNTLINSNPRMSSVVITTPMQLPPPTSFSQANPLVNPSQEEIGNIVYEYNRQRYISSSLSNIQTQNTNPVLAEPVQNYYLITTPSTSTGQNT